MHLDDLRGFARKGLDLARAAGAEQAEVAAQFTVGSSVEFEKNDIAVAMSDESLSFGVRVFRDGRVGFAASNDAETLHATIEDALSIASRSPFDPFAGLPDPLAIEYLPGLWDEHVLEVGMDRLTAAGADLLASIKSADARAVVDSGSVDRGQHARVVCSTTGVDAGEVTTTLSATLFGMAVGVDGPGSFVVETVGSRNRGQFEELIGSLGERFARKAVQVLSPGRGRSYRGPVLLSPEAVSGLVVANLASMVNSSAIRRGKSPLRERLGTSIAAPIISFVDAAALPGAFGATTFDREGVPRQVFPLIEAGVFRAPPFDHREALAAGRSSTGHAAGNADSPPMVALTRPEILPGNDKLSSIVEGVSDRLLVSRFSGGVDTVTGDFSGVAKSGFLISGGDRRPVTETLIAGNLLELLQAVLSVSIETETVHATQRLPWVLVDGISVTAG